MFPYMINIIYC